MLIFFKKATIGQLVVILLTVFLLWARAFIAPVTMLPEATFSPLYELLYRCLSPMPRLASAIALLLVLAQGIWLNIMLSNHKIANPNSLTPLLVYIVAMSWDSTMLTITPTLLVNIMILGACSQLLSDGPITLATNKNFNATFFLSMAMLCLLPSACYLLSFIIVFITYKLYRWRDIVVSLLGLLAPLIVVFFYAYLSDKLDYYHILVKYDLSNIHLEMHPIRHISDATNLIFLALLFVSLMWHLTSGNDRLTYQRINARIMTIPLLAAAAMHLYYQLFPCNPQMIAFSFTFVMSGFLMADRKRRWVGELSLWILLLAAII